MLPLTLLNTSQGHPMLVELKNGETYNGHLISCDNWMNLTLREVILTSPDATKFHRLPECFIRGNHIKYIRIPDEIMDIAKDDVNRRQDRQDRGDRGDRFDNRNNSRRGGRGGYSSDRGRGRGRGSGRGNGRPQ